jgi:glutathione S-transferase
MILIGQYDSPFVRRVGIALRLYDLPFEHRPWSVFGDATRLAALNPLMRVPVVVLDDGTALTDSHLILDYLDSRVAEAAALAPRHEPARHRVLRAVGLATGLADKAVSLFYERRLHDTPSASWEARCLAQIRQTVALLEAERAAAPGPYWHHGHLTHADIALTCAWRFFTEAHPGLIDTTSAPAITAHAAHHEGQPVFREISQPFIAPA